MSWAPPAVEDAGPPAGDVEAAASGYPGHLALNVDGAQQVQAAPTQAQPLRLAVHRVEGSICTQIIAPYVKVHVVEPHTGDWHPKAYLGANHPAVYNLDEKDVPWLRTPGVKKPWQADLRESSHIRPFATTPCVLKRVRGGTQRPPPIWEEAFLVSEPLRPGSLLLFEVLEASSDDRLHGDADKGDMDVDETMARSADSCLGWAFLSVDSALAASRGRGRHGRLRLQLHRYCCQRRGGALTRCCGADPLDQEEESRPEVFEEYSGGGGGGGGEAAPTPLWNLLSRLSRRSPTGPAPAKRRRVPCPAVLEVSFQLHQQAPDLAKVAEALKTSLGGLGGLGREAPGSPMKAAAEGVGDGAGGGSAVELEDVPRKLLPHHLRHKDESCALPDSLLWQISAGKRGASRLSLSPSGQLLAAAAARQGGSSEIRVFCVATGRLHATCATAHDSLVYDMCWHAFTSTQAGVRTPSHQLLITCGSDCVVQIYEVPEEHAPQAMLVLRPHARLQLPGHVYTVRPHPVLSADPRRLVLLCGGHGFGLMLCEVERAWQAEAGGGSWIAVRPHLQEQVRYKYAAKGQASGQAALPEGPAKRAMDMLGGQAQAQAQAQEPQAAAKPDILCVRFSTQATSPDNLYASDAEGHLMLFTVRFDASLGSGQGRVTASLVRAYSTPELGGVPIYSFEVVTPQLRQGRRLSNVQLSMVDDWVLLNSRDHMVRIASLQRGCVCVELEMVGLESGTYPVRAVMSPDGAYVACGSESGELLVWGAMDGKALPPGTATPQVRLAGPVMDTVWSHRHHMVACCALDDQAPPLLIFIGGDPFRPPPPAALPDRPQVVLPPLRRPPALQDSFREDLAMVPASIAPPAADGHRWAAQWLENQGNSRSAIAYEEKRRMKEQILAQLFDKKASADLEQRFESRHLPGGMT